MDPNTWCLVVIYIGYWSSVDYLLWDVESTLELDYEGANILMGLIGPHSKLIYLVGMGYEGRIAFVHKGVLVIT